VFLAQPGHLTAEGYLPPVARRREQAEGLARYGAAAALLTTRTDYAKFLLEFLNPKPPDNLRLNEASRTEMLRSQVKKGNG
jgi:hypothetical protein